MKILIVGDCHGESPEIPENRDLTWFWLLEISVVEQMR